MPAVPPELDRSFRWSAGAMVWGVVAFLFGLVADTGEVRTWLLVFGAAGIAAGLSAEAVYLKMRR